MLDRELISDGIVSVLKTAIGSDLSVLTMANGDTTPAVIVARQRGPKPNLPYVTVDVANFILPSGWKLAEYFDGSNIQTYEILYEMFIDIKCFGPNSQDILRKFHALLSTEPTQQNISNQVFGASVQNQGNVLNTPDLLSTEFEEGATLTISMYIIDTLQDPDNAISTIQNANGTGTLVTGVDGDIAVTFDTTNV